MNTQANPEINVRQAVPFFMVSSMEASLRFYVDGLGFQMTRKWTPDGKVRWCQLELGEAALMLQEYRKDHPVYTLPGTRMGLGFSVCFICRDALAIYRQTRERGIEAQPPFVGNGMWVTSLTDPDGYRIDFESVTDAPEESIYSEAQDSPDRAPAQ